MQQRFRLGGRVKISGFSHQAEILIETGTRIDMLPQRGVFAGGYPKPPHDEAESQHQNEIRQNTSDTLRVKFGVAERPRQKSSENDAGDEVPRDHKENVNAEEPARQILRKRMKQQNRKHGQRPQSRDIRPPQMLPSHRRPG